MNKTNAKEIARTITFDQLSKMFDNAKDNIVDWKVVSNVNKSMSKGTAWNILYRGLSPKIINHKLVVTNMIMEFGDYLDDDLKTNKLPKSVVKISITHQDPIF